MMEREEAGFGAEKNWQSPAQGGTLWADCEEGALSSERYWTPKGGTEKRWNGIVECRRTTDQPHVLEDGYATACAGSYRRSNGTDRGDTGPSPCPFITSSDSHTSYTQYRPCRNSAFNAAVISRRSIWSGSARKSSSSF